LKLSPAWTRWEATVVTDRCTCPDEDALLTDCALHDPVTLARVAQLQAEVEALRRDLRQRTTAAFDFKDKAEAAEARVAQLGEYVPIVAALAIYGEDANLAALVAKARSLGLVET
jgi:hypothetical protein